MKAFRLKWEKRPKGSVGGGTPKEVGKECQGGKGGDTGV